MTLRMLGGWKKCANGLEHVVAIEKGFITAEDREMFCYPDWNLFTDKLVVPILHLLKVHRNYPFCIKFQESSSLYQLIPSKNRYGLGESHEMEDGYMDDGPDLTSIPLRDRRLIYDIVTFVLIPQRYVPKYACRAYEFEKGFQTFKGANEAASLLYFKDGIDIIGRCSDISLILPTSISKGLSDFLSKTHEVYGYSNIPIDPQRTNYGRINVSYEEASSTSGKLAKILDKRFRTKISHDN